MSTIKTAALLAATLAGIAGCTNLDGSPDRTATGGLVGAGTGALIGSLVGDGGATIAGGALGAMAGAAIGNHIDSKPTY